MKSIRNFRFQLRVTQGALLLALGLATTAAVSTHQLLLDAANHPASDFNLTSTHVVGTLDVARLSTRVPLMNTSSQLTIPSDITTLGGVITSGNASMHAGVITAPYFTTDYQDGGSFHVGDSTGRYSFQDGSALQVDDNGNLIWTDLYGNPNVLATPGSVDGPGGQ